MKNKILRLKEVVFRVLEKENDDDLVIDCIKQTMPVWCSYSDVAMYETINANFALTV